MIKSVKTKNCVDTQGLTMPCYDTRDKWDHKHSDELQKLLQNIINEFEALCALFRAFRDSGYKLIKE